MAPNQTATIPDTNRDSQGFHMPLQFTQLFAWLPAAVLLRLMGLERTATVF